MNEKLVCVKHTFCVCKTYLMNGKFVCVKTL